MDIEIKPGETVVVRLIGSDTSSIRIDYYEGDVGRVEIRADAPRRNIPNQRTTHHLNFWAKKGQHK